MAYRFGAKLSLSREVTRIFDEEATAAVACLSRSDERKRDKNIHEARKSVKKLRALLRLVAPEWPKRVARQENEQLRSIGRRLSELRDAHAVIDAFAKVSGDLGLGEDVIRAGTEFLTNRKKQLAANVDVSAVMQEAGSGLTEAAKRANTRKLRPGGFDVVETGLKRSYKRGRQARAEAKKTETTDSFHNWRKRVKEHWYHSRLLSEVNSESWNSRIEGLKTLEGLLGDDHNLAVLSAIFKEHESLKPICEKLSEVSRQLRAEALKTGKGLYKKKWSAVADDLRDAHSVWPAGPIRKTARSEQPKAKARAATA